jgi:hypothetical protein
MRKTLAISMTVALAIFGINTANAFDYTLSPGIQISSMLSDTPGLKAGGGEFYPVMNHLMVYGDLNLDNLKLDHNGEDLAIDTSTHLPTLSGKIKYTDNLTLTGAYNGFPVPIPVVLAGPMDVGHINFGSGDVSLDSNDKAILRAIAAEVRDTGLTGIYLVGRTDSVGSVDSNFTVSYKRVMAAKAYLKSYLAEIGVVNPMITTEYMGELTATGTDSKSYMEDRRVDVTIYPII